MRWIASVSLAAVLIFQASTARCEFPHHHQQAHAYQKGEGPPERDEEPEKGGFVRGPGTGVRVGESATIGIEGPTIRIPEFSLKLPSLRLPSLMRISRPPQMELDRATAPFVGRVERAEMSIDGTERDDEGPPERDDDPSQKLTPLPLQKVSAQQLRLEGRIAQLEALLTRVESHVAPEPVHHESARRSQDHPQTQAEWRQPKPLPEVFATRPASYAAPVDPVAQLHRADQAYVVRQSSAEQQIAELRELVMTLQQQQSSFLRQIANQRHAAVRQPVVRRHTITRLPSVNR